MKNVFRRTIDTLKRITEDDKYIARFESLSLNYTNEKIDGDEVFYVTYLFANKITEELYTFVVTVKEDNTNMSEKQFYEFTKTLFEYYKDEMDYIFIQDILIAFCNIDYKQKKKKLYRKENGDWILK